MMRRNAERFDALVGDHRLDPDAVDARTAELLELVGALRAVPQPQARPEFVSDLRAQLMAAAETELVPAARSREQVTEKLTVTPRRTRRDRRFSVAIGAVAILGATSSMAVASQGALPGDALYPVKRAIESTQTGFSVSDQAKGATLLGNATDRLAEVRALVREEDADADLVRSTLESFTAQATQGSDLLMSDYEQTGHEGSVERLREFTVSSVDTLSGLEAAVPDGAHDALLKAAQALFTIDAAAEQVCPTCSGDGITEIPGQLLASAETPTEAPELLADGPIAGTESDAPAEVDTPDPVSGLEPPEVPVQIPSTLPVLPTPTPTPGQQSGQGQQGQQGGQQSGQGQHGGQGNGVKPPKATNLPEAVESLTGTVDGTLGAVGGVVGGLTGVLTGLTNGVLGQPSQAPQSPRR